MEVHGGGISQGKGGKPWDTSKHDAEGTAKKSANAEKEESKANRATQPVFSWKDVLAGCILALASGIYNQNWIKHAFDLHS